MRLVDRELSREEAQELHQTAIDRLQLMMWTVTYGTADYGDQYIARPEIIGPGWATFLQVYLVGESLAEVRSKLPYGLSCIGRQDGDDPVIVEVWL